MIPGRVYTPEDLVRLAWKWRWLFVLATVFATLAGVVFADRLPNRYRAETVILVVPQRVPEVYVPSAVTTRIEDRLQFISQQILSRSRLEGVIEAFGLYPDAQRRLPMEDVVERMKKDIKVDVVRAGAFKVSYESEDRTAAARVAERLGSLIIEENLRDREVLAEGTSQFLASQLEDARRRLVEHEQKLEDFRRRYAGELPSQVPANLQAAQNTQMQVQSLVESINRDRDRRLMLERQLADARAAAESAEATPAPPPATPGADADAAPASQRLEGAMAALRALETRLKPEHPDVIRMKKVVSDLQVEADTEARAVPLSVGGTAVTDPAETAQERRIRETRTELANLDRQVAQKEEQERQLRSTAAEYQRRIETSLTRESELTELMRDYETLESAYTTLLAKKEASQVSANLERREIGEQFRVLDPARVPQRPFSPNRPRMIGMASALGLALAAGIAALVEYRDTTLKTDDDVVTALALPVLAVVPVMTTARETAQMRRRNRLMAVARFAALAMSVGALVLLLTTRSW
jgi:polysaccharide chain length determinant protein (PEP-CTERM system associated)